MKYIILLIISSLSLISYADNIVYETEWIDSSEMKVTLEKMSANRLFPCQVNGMVDGIEIRYQGSYCPYLVNMDYFYSRWGMSDNWYSKYTSKYVDEGFKEYSHTAFLDLSGNVVHQATWVLVNE